MACNSGPLHPKWLGLRPSKGPDFPGCYLISTSLDETPPLNCPQSHSDHAAWIATGPFRRWRRRRCRKDASSLLVSPGGWEDPDPSPLDGRTTHRGFVCAGRCSAAKRPMRKAPRPKKTEAPAVLVKERLDVGGLFLFGSDIIHHVFFWGVPTSTILHPPAVARPLPGPPPGAAPLGRGAGRAGEGGRAAAGAGDLSDLRPGSHATRRGEVCGLRSGCGLDGVWMGGVTGGRCREKDDSAK